MPGISKILDVPYFAQPTGVTCQSTVLKMFASYIEDKILLQSTGAGDRDILAIWKDVNTGKSRPSQMHNAHVNMKWWLEKYFPRLKFQYLNTKDPSQAIEKIVRFIDGGFPVLVAVSHVNVPGHIILVVGYENFRPNQSSADFALVVHDPYGQFDPTLKSKLWGARRFQGGASLMSGGQRGPGMNVRLPILSVSRQRAGDAALGTFYMISATR